MSDTTTWNGLVEKRSAFSFIFMVTENLAIILIYSLNFFVGRKTKFLHMYNYIYSIERHEGHHSYKVMTQKKTKNIFTTNREAGLPKNMKFLKQRIQLRGPSTSKHINRDKFSLFTNLWTQYYYSIVFCDGAIQYYNFNIRRNNKKKKLWFTNNAVSVKYLSTNQLLTTWKRRIHLSSSANRSLLVLTELVWLYL